MFKKIVNDFKFDLILLIALATGAVFIYSTYAWLSSSMDVTISNFKMTADTTNGLYISLDGVEWTDSIKVDRDSMLNLLKETYPGNKTQWTNGMTTVSSPGIRNNSSEYFDFFGLTETMYRPASYYKDDKFTFEKLNEDERRGNQRFVAFDVFFKNVTPSPYDDNIYFDEGTRVIDTNVEDENNVITQNAIRVGILFYDTVPLDSNINTIQNITCNGMCRDIIYEPNSRLHSTRSIDYVHKYRVEIQNGEFYETYALKKEGKDIPVWTGIPMSGFPINTEYFQRQYTLTSGTSRLTNLPRGITKARVYIWLEGQDIDILEAYSEGYKVAVTLNFRKDYASYEK